MSITKVEDHGSDNQCSPLVALCAWMVFTPLPHIKHKVKALFKKGLSKLKHKLSLSFSYLSSNGYKGTQDYVSITTKDAQEASKQTVKCSERDGL